MKRLTFVSRVTRNYNLPFDTARTIILTNFSVRIVSCRRSTKHPLRPLRIFHFQRPSRGIKPNRCSKSRNRWDVGRCCFQWSTEDPSSRYFGGNVVKRGRGFTRHSSRRSSGRPRRSSKPEIRGAVSKLSRTRVPRSDSCFAISLSLLSFFPVGFSGHHFPSSSSPRFFFSCSLLFLAT